MKEIQAQLNDLKKRAERRAAEAEEHLRVEKENAATMIVGGFRQLRREVDERTVFNNTHAMMLDDFERHLPAGQGQRDYPQTPGPSSTRVEREGNDMSEDQGGSEIPVNSLRPPPPPQVGYFSHSDLPC